MTAPKMHVRELQVLTAAAAGLTGRESAQQMSVSYETVRKWRQSALEKLGSSTVTKAVVILMREGVIK